MKPQDNEALDGRIAVALEGEAIDLDDACVYFSEDTGIQVRRMHIPPNDTVVLLADDLNGLTDDRQIYSSAKRLIDLVNGVLFLQDSNRRPIVAQGIVHRQAANGNWGVTVWAEGLAAGRSRMRAFTNAPGQPSPQAILLSKVTRNERASDVLTHLRGEPDWFDLYKAYELMRDDIARRLGRGGSAKIGWPGHSRISQFTMSAQVYRHAKSDWPNGMTPATAMPLTEARCFLQSLCSLWLETV